jgi:hypothetical protein
MTREKGLNTRKASSARSAASTLEVGPLNPGGSIDGSVGAPKAGRIADAPSRGCTVKLSPRPVLVPGRLPDVVEKVPVLGWL